MFSFSWMKKLLSRLDPVAYAVRRNRRKLRARAGLERKTLRLPNGLEIAYLDEREPGDARVPLVLLHGIGSSKDNWPRLARRLTGRFRILAPDLPGFGESSRPGSDALPSDALPSDDAANYDSRAQAENVRLFAEALGLGRFHLGGSSMGGRIAAVYAGTHPETLRSLWLVAPGGVRAGEPSEMLRRIGRGERVPIFARTAEEYADLLDFTMSQPPDVPGPAMRVLAAEAAPHYDLNLRIFDVFSEEWRSGVSTEDALRGVAVPTLLVWGTEDRVLDPSGADALANALAGRVTVRRMDNVGHLPMLEVPEQTAQDYLAFHDSLAAAG